MCGIVGMVTKAANGFTTATENAFYQMLWADTLRGDDSTGVIHIHNDASFGILKDVGPATVVGPKIQEHAQLKPMWQSGKALIGHNRKKTVGAVSAKTAHPFVVDKSFAMVHNGTLYNHQKLANTEVDSEALAIHLNKVLGEDHSKAKFEEAVGEVFGAFAVAAYDQDSHQIYLTRNKERPLFLLDTPTCIMWASEGLMLMWIAARCGIDFKGQVAEQIKEHELVTIDLETNKIHREEYVPKKAWVATTTTYSGGSGVTKQGQQTSPTVVTSKKRISKNAFKHIRKANIGRKLEFYACDYVEKDFPKTLFEGASEVYLLGDTTSFSFPHIVRGLFDLNDAPKRQYEIDGLYYNGTITDMTYESISGFVTIFVDTIAPTPLSTGGKNETSTKALTVH